MVYKEEKTVEQPKPMKFDDLMKTLDPQSQNIMNEMKKAYIENKKNLFNQILANKSNTFTKEQLGAFDDIDVLKGIAALAKSTTPVANNSNPLSIMQGQYAALTNQFIFDSFFNIKMARPMPMYSVPGSIDHF